MGGTAKREVSCRTLESIQLNDLSWLKHTMNFASSLEKNHHWRLVGLILVFGIVLFPTIWLIVATSSANPTTSILEISRGPFLIAFQRSLVQGFWILCCTLVLSWPMGVVLGLNKFPLRRLTFAMLVVPLFMPTFLWAIGISMSRASYPYRLQKWFDGLPGSVLALSTLTVPFVILATVLAVKRLQRSQRDSIRLAGGSWALYRTAGRFAFPASFSASLLGAFFTMADQGVAQIMGYHGASSEILIAFAARHDVPLAAMKSVILCVFLLPFILPISWFSARRMESEFVGRGLLYEEREKNKFSHWVFGMLLLAVPIALFFMPISGLVRPLKSGVLTEPMKYTLNALRQSGPVTLFYSLMAGFVATFLGLALALCAGRFRMSRSAVLCFSFFFLSTAPAVHSLGLVLLASNCPPSLDFLVRSGWTVGIGLGLRFVPIATLLCLWPLANMSRSLNFAAAVHGVPGRLYLLKILAPCLAPTLVTSILVVGLLSAADSSTTLLLQPPGETTFAGRIFAIMDNSSERLVASFCLVYLIVGTVLVFAFLWLHAFQRKRAILAA